MRLVRMRLTSSPALVDLTGKKVTPKTKETHTTYAPSEACHIRPDGVVCLIWGGEIKGPAPGNFESVTENCARSMGAAQK